MAYDHELSQDEVDSLMRGMGGEADAAPTSAQTPAGGSGYRLGNDDRIVRARMHTLEVINERFSRLLRAALLVFMRRSADISVGAVTIQKYGDFVRNLPVPANINMVQMRPLRGTALFVFDPKLVFLVVDNLFGSDGRFHVRVEGRDFTQTEQRIIKRLLMITLESYGQAWQPVHPLDFDYVRAEMHARLAPIVQPNEMVVSTTFQVEFGPMGGLLTVCLPYAMIEPIRDLLSNPLQNEVEVDQRWTRQLAGEVQSAGIELRAGFAEVPTTISQLLSLKVGDVLPIELPETVTATVQGVPVLECGWGQSNERYALLVHRLIQHQNHDNEGPDHG
jgi:flagellar motor switch protein FliM